MSAREERGHAERLFLFVCEPGKEGDLYTRTGLPRMHAAWEMQLLADEGLLFLLYARCVEALEGASRRGRDAWTAEALRERAEACAEAMDLRDPEALRARARSFYAERIEAFIRERRGQVDGGDPGRAVAFEQAVIEAYLGLAAAAPRATLTLDLFPAHTGPENLGDALKGLFTGLTRVREEGTRRFYSSRAQSYTRYYGMNLVRALDPDPSALRFSLVVPFANGVGHIALTRCWPIDGAENVARYLERVEERVRERVRERIEAGGAARARSRAAPGALTILVCGYSQGGAAVRLFDETSRGVDVRARPYFRSAAPRAYLERCAALGRLLERGREGKSGPGEGLRVFTISLAPMGGLDGVGLAERLSGALPEVAARARDQRGESGVRARANARGGLHLAICHDLDPVRWVLPGPLTNMHRRLLRGDPKLSIGRILLKFGGPGQALHGGVWAEGTSEAFRDNASARALLEDVARRRSSARFFDEHRYTDPRNRHAAFGHIVVGTYGYPGWAVLEALTRALATLSSLEAIRAGAPDLLLTEPSWRADILPEGHDYESIAAVEAHLPGPRHPRKHLLGG